MSTGEWVEKVASRDLSLAPKGYQQLSIGTSASGLTPPAGALYALLDVGAGGIRYRDDGPNPTGTVGMRLVEGSQLWYTGSLPALKMVRLASASADVEVNVLYYG